MSVSPFSISLTSDAEDTEDAVIELPDDTAGLVLPLPVTLTRPRENTCQQQGPQFVRRLVTAATSHCGVAQLAAGTQRAPSQNKSSENGAETDEVGG